MRSDAGWVSWRSGVVFFGSDDLLSFLVATTMYLYIAIIGRLDIAKGEESRLDHHEKSFMEVSSLHPKERCCRDTWLQYATRAPRLDDTAADLHGWSSTSRWILTVDTPI